MQEATKIHSIYCPGFGFPNWVLDESLWKTYKFGETIVFYKSSDSIQDIYKLLTEREPCNIGMKRFYDDEKLHETFGFSNGSYHLSTVEKLMPNIAVYTHSTVRLNDKYVYVHVINLIGAALDHPLQPDFQYFSGKPISVLIEFYRSMWLFALHAMTKTPCKTLQIFNVGGGSFAGAYVNNFITDVFEPAFQPLRVLFEQKGYTIKGFNWDAHQFNNDIIPYCLEKDDLDTTVYVNAWDPWTLIGNGNERDRSLDGCWGRISNMAVLGWLHTNPEMQFCKV